VAKDTKEAVKYRVRLFRKRQREELKRQNTYTWGLRQYFRARGMTSEWAVARDVYASIDVLNLRISFESFVTAIRGSKKDQIKPVKSIELSELIAPNGESILLIRPVHIPTPRRRK
jgi:hypothetical protein